MKKCPEKHIRVVFCIVLKSLFEQEVLKLENKKVKNKIDLKILRPPFNRAIACCIARPTNCSTISPITIDGTRKELMELLATIPLLIIDDLGMRKLPLTAAEELLEIVMRRYERTSTLLTSNRPVDDWGKLLGDSAAVTAMLDRLLHHGHVLKCGPRSWRTKIDLPPQEAAG